MRARQRKYIRLLGLLVLSLLCLGMREGWGESVPRFRFYDTHRSIEAEKELDWQIRRNKVDNLRLEFGATRQEFNPRRQDYIDYLDRTERDYKELLRKEEKILSAPYLSFEGRRDISRSYERQTKEVTDYYNKLRIDYYDCVRKSALIRIVSFPIRVGITLATAGQALPVLLPLQTAKFTYDEYAFGKSPLRGTLTQGVIDKLYGFGMCFYSAFGIYEHAHILSTGKDLSGKVICNTTFPTLARLEYFRAGYTVSTPFIQTVSEYCPNSFLAKASPYLDIANSSISIGMEVSKPYQFGKEFGNSPAYGARYFNNFSPSIYSLTTNSLNIVQNVSSIAGGHRWANSGVTSLVNQGISLGALVADARVRHYKHNNVEYIKQRTNIYKDNFEYRPKVTGDRQFTDLCNNEMRTLEKMEMNSRALSETEKIIEQENLWGSEYYKILTPAEVLRREKVPIEQRDFSMEAPCISPVPANIYSGLLGIEGKKSAIAWIYYKRGEETLPYVSFDIDGEKLNCFMPYNIDYLAGRYQDVHLENKGKFSIRAYFPEELRGTESEPHIYYGYDEKDSFIVDMQDKRYNRDWMKTIDSGISYASLGQDRFLLLGSAGAMTALNTRLNVNSKYDYFIQISKNYSLTQSGDFRVFTDGKVYENPLVKELNQPRKQFFESFGNPLLWRQSDNLLEKQYGASYGSQEKEFLSRITFEATPQNLARRYDPWLQHYTLRNQGVEQIQDASGRYQTINRLNCSIERLGKVRDINGELQPAIVEGHTRRGGGIGEYTYVQSLEDPANRVYVHEVGERKNIIYTLSSSEMKGSVDLYSGKYEREEWEGEIYGEPLDGLYASREELLGSARGRMGGHVRNTDILNQVDELSIENVNRRDFEYLKSVKEITRDRLIPTQKTIEDVMKMQRHIDSGNDWSNWEFRDERREIRNGSELLTTPQDVAREENISKDYRMVPWTTDFLKDSETKIISNFQFIESGGNLRKERLSLEESEGWGTKAIFALDELEKTEVLYPCDGEVARENIGRLHDRLEEKVEYDHTYFPSERIFCLQKMVPAATALVGYAGLKLDSRSIKVGTGILQLAQGRVPTGLSAVFSSERAPVMRMFGPRLGKTVYELYQKTPAQKISYIDLADGVLRITAAGVSGYEFGKAFERCIEERSGEATSNFGFKAAGTLVTLGVKRYPKLLLLQPVVQGLDWGLERVTEDPIIIDATRELLKENYSP